MSSPTSFSFFISSAIAFSPFHLVSLSPSLLAFFLASTLKNAGVVVLHQESEMKNYTMNI